ncbi:F-box protein At3g07870-like [Apium graveolens]|uniref:F-box protein At3g07870-like n=1 Tax=Apium graveolens TaxID=4045 RepID=UPI003D7A84F4
MDDRRNLTKKATMQREIVEFGKKINHVSLIDVVSESLLMNIFAGLPIASICALRCVCKLYFKLISEKWFTKRFVELSPYTTIVFNNDFGVHLVELAKGYCKSYKSIFPGNYAKIVGSCNGLLFFLVVCPHGFFRQPVLYICNPVLGQYATLPKPPPCDKIHNSDRKMKDVYGFGSGSSTDNYKILRISTLVDPPHPIYSKRSDAQVYIVGTKTWKSLGYLPYPSNEESLAAIVEGAFHWLFYNEMIHVTSVYAFNIEEERYYQISFPQNIGNGNINMNVGVLNDCLCLFDNSDPAHLDIWSMKEYGVGESWALKCILTTSIIPAGLDSFALHPITVMKDEEIFMKSGSGNFYTYNQKNMNITRFEIDNMELLAEFNNHAVHSSNFCPLDLILAGYLVFDKFSVRCTCGYTF